MRVIAFAVMKLVTDWLARSLPSLKQTRQRTARKGAERSVWDELLWSHLRHCQPLRYFIRGALLRENAIFPHGSIHSCPAPNQTCPARRHAGSDAEVVGDYHDPQKAKVIRPKRIGGDDEILVTGGKDNLFKDVLRKMQRSRICKEFLAEEKQCERALA